MKTKILILVLILLAVVGLACNDQHSTYNNKIDPNRNARRQEEKTNVNNTNQNLSNQSEIQSSPNAAKAPYDLQFLDTMTAHHQAAIGLAKLAETKAARAELKTLAKNIIASQEKEINTMKSLREKWYAGQPEAINLNLAEMADSMKGMDKKKLESLSGNAFELEFIKQMIPLHESAVLMSSEASQKSQREEIKTLAASIIKVQESEAKQIKDWLSAWSK